MKALGSDSVSPGGGAAASLTGAAGTALVEMVSRINEKRWLKKHPSQKASRCFKKNISLLERNRVRFIELIKLDTLAFLRLSCFSKKDGQKAAYQNALKRAAGAPLEMCRLAVSSLEAGGCEASRTSRWLASDLLEAGILLEASLCSSRLNVEINLVSIKDKRTLKKVKRELTSLAKKINSFNKKISLRLES